MRIVKVETIRNTALPNVLWVQVHTEDGLVGLGETYYLPGAVEAVIHDLIATFVLGRSMERLRAFGIRSSATAISLAMPEPRCVPCPPWILRCGIY